MKTKQIEWIKKQTGKDAFFALYTIFKQGKISRKTFIKSMAIWLRNKGLKLYNGRGNGFGWQKPSDVKEMGLVKYDGYWCLGATTKMVETKGFNGMRETKIPEKYNEYTKRKYAQRVDNTRQDKIDPVLQATISEMFG